LKGGTPILVLPMSRSAWLGAPNNYSQGARFSAIRNLSSAGGDYSFSSLANDSLLETSIGPIAGPNVISQPSDLALCTFSDDPPVVGDAGRPGVKMFSGVLQASANSVSFTGLRVDRVGSSTDSDLAGAKVYE